MKLKSFMLAACMLVAGVVLTACNTKNDIVLTLSAGDVSTVRPGGTVQFSTTSSDENIDNLTYVVTHGDTYATITNDGLLTVLTTATPGSEIKVVSKKPKSSEENSVLISSNTVTLTVGHIEATSIELSANKASVMAGASVKLTKAITPANATVPFVYEIIQGQDIAELGGDNVLVSESATPGDVIKIKAVQNGGDLESNVITITVEAPAPEEFHIVLNDAITVKYPSTSSSTISAMVIGSNGIAIGQNVEFEVISGKDLLSITPNGYNCALTVLGHGEAVIKATLDNGRSDTITVTCIRTPDGVLLPEVFTDNGRNSIEYAVSNKTPFKFEAVAIASAQSTVICEKIEYIFEKYVSGAFVAEAFAGEVGTYNKITGEIKFNQNYTGIARVTAQSDSGNFGFEKKDSQVFEVNSGINVSTWEEFQAALNSNINNVGLPINFVVLSKLGYGYNYEIVPERIANGTANDEYIANTLSVLAYGSLTINGNKHNVNLSKMKQHSINNADGDKMPSRFIEVRPVTSVHVNTIVWYESNPTANSEAIIAEAWEKYYAEINRPFDVTIKNFNLMGNNSVNGINDDGNPYGSFKEGIRIGWAGTANKAFKVKPDAPEGIVYGRVPCKLTMEDSYLAGFMNALRVEYILDGYVSDVNVEECFSTGITTVASIMTFNNMTYGYCGAFGIEISPDSANMAGVNFNENQQINFTGSVTSTNLNNGQTPHMQSLKLGKAIVADMIRDMVTGGSTADSQSNVGYDDGKDNFVFNYVTLIFNKAAGEVNEIPVFEENSSQVTFYPNTTDIIDFTPDMGVNTTHKYIKVTLQHPYAAALNEQTAPIGYIICYNLNYGK